MDLMGVTSILMQPTKLRNTPPVRCDIMATWLSIRVGIPYHCSRLFCPDVLQRSVIHSDMLSLDIPFWVEMFIAGSVCIGALGEGVGAAPKQTATWVL